MHYLASYLSFTARHRRKLLAAAPCHDKHAGPLPSLFATGLAATNISYTYLLSLMRHASSSSSSYSSISSSPSSAFFANLSASSRSSLGTSSCLPFVGPLTALTHVISSSNSLSLLSSCAA